MRVLGLECGHDAVSGRSKLETYFIAGDNLDGGVL